DLRAAALDSAAHGHRNWRVLRAMRTRHLLARGGSLVAGSVEARRRDKDPEHAVLEMERLAAGAGLAEAAGFRAMAAAGRETVSVADARNRRWLRALHGVRIEAG